MSKRLAGVLVRLGLAGLVVVLLVAGGRSLGGLVPAITARVETLGVLAPIAFILFYAIAEVAFVPGSLLTLAAGAVFGVLRGTIFALVGATRLETITIPFEEVDRAVLEGETDGFLRVHLKPGSDRILGATIVGEHAGELIAEAAVAITNSQGLAALGRTIHPYPTRGEAYRKAADAWRRGRLTPKVRRVLETWFRLFR